MTLLMLFIPAAMALPEIKPVYSTIAGPEKGVHLRWESDCGPEGHCSKTYQIVSSKGEVLKSYLIDKTAMGDLKQLVSDERCQERLRSLANDLKTYNIRDVETEPESCSRERVNTVKKVAAMDDRRPPGVTAPANSREFSRTLCKTVSGKQAFAFVSDQSDYDARGCTTPLKAWVLNNEKSNRWRMVSASQVKCCDPKIAAERAP